MRTNGPVYTTPEKTYEFKNLIDGLIYVKHRIDIPVRRGERKQKRIWWSLPGHPETKVRTEEMALYNQDLIEEHRRTRPDEPVLHLEGEEKVNAAVRCGYTAFCTAGSASQRKFGDAFNVLTGLTVIQVPDYDQAGRTYMDVTASVYGGIAAEVRRGAIDPFVPPPAPDEPNEEYTKRISGWDIGDLYRECQENERNCRRLIDQIVAGAATVPSAKPSATSVEEELTAIPTVSLRTAFATPPQPVEYVIDGLLNKGGTSCLSGPFKGGKSTLLRIMAVNIALGRPFMGRDTSPCNIGYLSLEEPENGVRDHFQVLADYLEQDESEAMLDRIFYHAGDQWLPAKPEEKIDMVWEYIDKNNLGLLILGPIQDFFNFRNINDYSEVKPLVRAFTNRVARKTGCHVCFDHHNSKMGQGRNAFLGTVAIGGGVDQLLTLTVVEDAKGEVIGRGINTWQRYGESILSLMGLTYVPNRLGVTIGAPPETMREQAGLQSLAIRITAFCQQWTDVKVMEEEIRGRRETRLDALAWALDQGMLVRRPRKGRGGGYEYKDRGKAESDGDDPGTSSGTSSDE